MIALFTALTWLALTVRAQLQRARQDLASALDRALSTEALALAQSGSATVGDWIEAEATAEQNMIDRRARWRAAAVRDLSGR